MADISKDELRKEIAAILKDADLTSTSSKKVRQQIEEKLDVDLSDRKKEVDDLVMECLKEKQDGKKKNSKDEDDEEDDEEEEEEDEEEEDEKPKAKRAAKKPSKRPKKGSSEESDEGSDDDASDEEYNPSKKAKGGSPKKGKPPAKKKKGSDSDSDEDWAKARKSSSGGGGGGGGGAKKKGGAKRGGGGGYIKAKSLSPELAALMGQDSMPRHEVVKKIWGIIKERNLYDPKNKQFAICDDELMKVFGVKRFRMFGMMKYLKNHFVD